MKRFRALIGDALFLRHFHGWATIFWLVAALPISIWLNNSIPLLVFISVYAIVISHWGAWQTSRVERRADERDPDTPT